MTTHIAVRAVAIDLSSSKNLLPLAGGQIVIDAVIDMPAPAASVSVVGVHGRTIAIA